MTGRNLLLHTCCILLIRSALALYGRKSAVQLLDAKSFDKVVTDQNMAAMVEFFAPWCGHCKNLAPTYEKVAQNLQGIATVAAVDCDADKNKPLCARFQVQGFPTLKTFPAQGRQRKSAQGGTTKSPTDYQGPRTAKGIKEALVDLIPSKYIRYVKGKVDLEVPTPALIGSSARAPLALLFTDKTFSSSLYKSLSVRFIGNIAFAEARSKDNADLVQEYNISSFPTLLLIPPGKEPVSYRGELKPAPLLNFLRGFAPGFDAAVEPPLAEPSAEQGTAKKAKKEPEIPNIVRDVTLQEVQRLAEQEDAFLLASFTSAAPDFCKAEALAFNKLAFDLQDIIPVGQINLTGADNAALKAVSHAAATKPCSFSLILLPFGDKPDPDEWPKFSGEQTVKAVQAFALEAYPAALVPRLATMDTMQGFLQSDVAHPKIILFTNKPETPGIFRALAANLRNTSFSFADVSSESVGLTEQFGIKKIPSMALAFLDQPEDAPGLEATGKMRLQVYPGPLKYPLMAAYLNAAAQALGFAEAASEDGSASMSSSSKPQPVAQASTNAQLQEACPSTSSLCIFGLMDSSSQEHSAAVAALEAAAGRHRSFAFVWVDAPTQPSFAAGYGIGLGEVPTAVAVSRKRERYQRLRGSLTAASLSSLVEGLATGKGYSVPFQESPQLVDGGEAAAEQLMEEDFDLADIMGESMGTAGIGSKEARLQEIEAELQAEGEASTDAAAEQKTSKKKKKRKAKKATGSDEL